MLRKHPQLLPQTYEEFVTAGVSPALSRTKGLLRDMLKTLGTTYMIVDGLDECDSLHQRQVLADLSTLLPPDLDKLPNCATLKVLVCSRETIEIKRKLNKGP